MPDRIVGVAVLDPPYLHVCCQKESGEKNCTALPCIPVGAEVPKDLKEHPMWRYTRLGPQILRVTPSLNWVSWGFHNEGTWEIEFVESSRGALLCFELNMTQWPTEEDRQKLLSELRRP